jgi:hypothetical protein
MNTLNNDVVVDSIQHWAIHNIDAALETLGAAKNRPADTTPYIATGASASDTAKLIHTGFLIEMDLASLRIRTTGGVYQLVGPGFFTAVIPKSLPKTVRDSQCAVAFFQNQQLRWMLGEEWMQRMFASSLPDTTHPSDVPRGA